MEQIKQCYRKTTVLFLLTLSLLATSQMANSVSEQFSIGPLSLLTFTGNYEACDKCTDPYARPIYRLDEGDLYVKEGFIIGDANKRRTFTLEPIPSEGREKADTDLATLNAINGKIIISLKDWLIHERVQPSPNFFRSAETYTL